ncbi:MAG: hypothetical protein N2446_02435 [Elusimicrobiales bacterium]|nr:hypothetical protein [Elusimicrobiales bacterium]
MINLIRIFILICCIFCDILYSQHDKKINIKLYFEPFNPVSWQNYIYLDLVSRKVSDVNLMIYPFIKKDSEGWKVSYGEAELKEIARFQALIDKYPLKLNSYLRVRALNMSPDGWKDSLIYASINPIEFENYVSNNKVTLLEKAYKKIELDGISQAGVYIEGDFFESFSKITEILDKVNKFLPEGRKINLYTKELSKIKPPRFIVAYDKDTEIFIDNNVYISFKNMFGEIKDERISFENLDSYLKEKIFALPAYLIEKKDSVVEYLNQAVKQKIIDDIGNYYVYYDMRNKSKLLKFKSNKKLEIFIMSQCPFGVKAVESIINYVEGGKINSNEISIHYIGDVYEKNGDYIFNSLHGDEEWKENMRQIVIAKYYPDKFLSYLKKRSKNYTSSDWQTVAKDVGIDVDNLSKKIESDGKKLLADDFKYTSLLKINVSPTFIVEGNLLVVGIDNLKKFKGFEDIKVESLESGSCGK